MNCLPLLSLTLAPAVLLGPLMVVDLKWENQEPVTELSVENRASLDAIPEWYFEKPHSTGQGIVMVAKTGPFLSPAAADDALNDSIRELVRAYLNRNVGVNLPAMVFTDEQVEQWIVAGRRKSRRFGEQLAENYGVNPDHYFAFAQICLDHDTIEPFSQLADDGRIAYRLKVFAIVGGGVLGLIGILWGWLKIDQATRGFYSRTLFRIAVVLAVLMVTGLGLLIRFIS